MLLQHRSSDEYRPVAWSKRDQWAVARAVSRAEAAGDTLHNQHQYAASRRGTATALRAIDEAWGGGYYTVDPQAETDPEAADAAFEGDELVIDVQTHYIARHRAHAPGVEGIMWFIRSVAPDRWEGLDPAIHLDLGNYLRHIFLESETAAAVLTCTPGDDNHSILTNPEVAATRELIDRLAGTGRLIKSLEEAGIGPGGNVYAELGSTWYVLSRRPREAAHVLGKLLNAVGEDNVVWGSDSIWYGSPQPLIDAFRAFQIPEELRQRHGYPELTPRIKEKILGLNAARVYGIDPDLTRSRVTADDLSWVKAAFDEYIDTQ